MNVERFSYNIIKFELIFNLFVIESNNNVGMKIKTAYCSALWSHGRIYDSDLKIQA